MTIAEVKRLNREAGGYFFEKGKGKTFPYVRKVQNGYIFATLQKADYGNRAQVWLQGKNGRIGFLGAITAHDFPTEWMPHFYPSDPEALSGMVDRLPANVASIILKVLQRADKIGFYLTTTTGA